MITLAKKIFKLHIQINKAKLIDYAINEETGEREMVKVDGRYLVKLICNYPNMQIDIFDKKTLVPKWTMLIERHRTEKKMYLLAIEVLERLLKDKDLPDPFSFLKSEK